MGDLKGVDANLIVVLDAVLRERNLTHAGHSLGVTQSAVSNSVKKLRAALDDRLLVRSGRQFELTPKAAALQPQVAEALLQIDRALGLHSPFDPLEMPRRFYIATSEYAMATLTGPLMQVLDAEAPDVSVDFSPLPPMHPGIGPADLLKYDLMIAGTGSGLFGKRQALYSDELVCVVSRDNPWLRDGALTIEDLSSMRHVVAPQGPAENAPDPMLRLAELGVEAHAAISIGNFVPVPAIISGTPLVGFVPRRLAEQYAAPLDLVIADTPLTTPIVVESAYWHPSKTGDPAVQWLLTVLRRTAELIEFGTQEWP